MMENDIPRGHRTEREFEQHKALMGNLERDAVAARGVVARSEALVRKLFGHVASAAEHALRANGVDIGKKIFHPCKYLMDSIATMIHGGDPERKKSGYGLLAGLHQCASKSECPASNACNDYMAEKGIPQAGGIGRH